MRPTPDPIGPGQESVWDYPRPVLAEPSTRHVRIVHLGIVIADTRAPVRTLETSHPPSWYLPPADIRQDVLRRSDRRSFCEWKGEAIYWHVDMGGVQLRDVAWSYPNPTPGFAMLRDRRRAGPAASGRLLRGVDHLGPDRPVQGRAGKHGVVSLASSQEAR